MKARVIGLVVVLVLGSVSCASWANGLDIGVVKYTMDGGGPTHRIGINASKTGAVSCELTTPGGTYNLVPAGDRFEGDANFWNDYTNISFTDVADAFDSNWTLVWDAAGANETIATIDNFGALAEADFLALPVLTAPTGAVAVPPNPTIDWTWSGDGSEAGFEDQDAWVGRTTAQPFELELIQDSNSFTGHVRSWTPPELLANGTWLAGVNANRSFRTVGDGFGTVTGDPWVIEGTWLLLSSTALGQFAVVTPGDVNGDGNVDNLDITPFVYALTSGQGAFEAQYPDGAYWGADCHQDGNVDNLDISPFVDLLTSGGQAAPEPATMMLLVVGSLALLRRRRWFITRSTCVL